MAIRVLLRTFADFAALDTDFGTAPAPDDRRGIH